MPAPAWEDLSIFFDDQNGFATPVQVISPGPARTFKGILDDPFLNAELGEQERDTSSPMLTCRATDAADLRAGAVLQVHGRRYRLLTHPQDDGTGVVILRLAERNLP